MVLMNSAATLMPSKRLPYRADMALLGMYEISKSLCGRGSLQQVLASSLYVLQSFLEMGSGVIALLDKDGDPREVFSASHSTSMARRYFQALPEKAVGQMVVTEMPVVIENVARDTSFGDWDTSLWGDSSKNYTFIGVPIRDRDRVISVITIDREWISGGDMRTDEDVRFLKMVANQIGQTVRLHRMVIRDRERPTCLAPALQASWATARHCGRFWTSCDSWRAATPRCCCAANPGQVRNCLPRQCTTRRRARTRPSSS